MDRLLFKFYKSYFDVGSELNDKDRLAFYDALLNKQFYGIEPELTGMPKFAYISQKHSIDLQVKGWEDKTKSALNNNPMQGGAVGGAVRPTLQEEVKEKEKEEFINKIFFDSLSTSESWIEVNAKNNKISVLKTKEYLLRFNSNLIAQIDKKQNKSEYASHFARWLPLEIAKDSLIITKPKKSTLL